MGGKPRGRKAQLVRDLKDMAKRSFGDGRRAILNEVSLIEKASMSTLDEAIRFSTERLGEFVEEKDLEVSELDQQVRCLKEELNTAADDRDDAISAVEILRDSRR